MTRKEWLDRLEELAAEHVLGWQWNERTSHPETWGPPPAWLMPPDAPTETKVVGGRQIVRRFGVVGPFRIVEDPERPHVKRVPRYTRSISDAWKLVEAMEGRVGLELVRSRGEWCVRTHNPFCDSWAPTAPLAITLAALKAVGCEIPKEPTDAE